MSSSSPAGWLRRLNPLARPLARPLACPAAPRRYLSKSDFKTARECPAKLYYKKLGYPSTLEDDPYLAFLADGGYMVETMARLLYPGGRELGDRDRPEDAHRATRRALREDGAVLYEATVLDATDLARIDILRRDGSRLDLIEVKSASVDLAVDPTPFRGQRGGILSKWRPYLEDVAFQAFLLERVCPRFEVRPFLCVIDTSKAASAAVTFERFRLVPPPPGAPPARAGFEYLGDPGELRRDHLLAVLDVRAEVEELREEVERDRRRFADSVRGPRLRKLPGELGQKCKSCEYRGAAGEGEPDGFAECWGPLAKTGAHILDLFRVDLLGGRERDLPAELAARGTANWNDVPGEAFRGAGAERQRIQIESTAAGREWISPELGPLLTGCPYPLHFIDFEGSRLALPYHEGMHPYEQVGFQWSCHTIREPGGSIEHAEWLNDRDSFPNFDFARTLKDRIGSEGTVFIWSSYETTMLSEVREQMERYPSRPGAQDAELARWLEAFVADDPSRVVDLCEQARLHYFHPEMKGSVSIKAVFPAVWGENPAVRELSCFAGMAGSADPYKSLPPARIGGREEVVQEGTGAIRIYQELMFGLSREDEAARDAYRQLLLQYCALDTAAMVGIWWHWMQLAGPEAPARPAGSPAPPPA